MRTLRILLFIVSVGFLGCKKDNGSKLPVIKGIQKKDINGQPIGVDGEPNVKLSENGSVMNTSVIFAYPNPAGSQLNLSIGSPKGKARIWMVRGRYKGGKFGPNHILGIGMNIPIDMTVDLQNNAQFSFDLADVPNGYYRLYVEFDSYTLWDNIKVDK